MQMDATQSHGAARARVEIRRGNVAARLERLQRLAHVHPAAARQELWRWLGGLRSATCLDELSWLFDQGTAPAAPQGDCEGIVFVLYGAPWLVAVDRLVRLGRWLGGIGWTGKSFDAAAGTGHNRLTRTARIPALLAMPSYRFDRAGDELLGFRFRHELGRSPLWPHPEVRSIRYDSPEDANPLMLPSTRDELVELIPGVYLGRALLRGPGGFRVVGYFGLRHPMTEAP